MFSHHQWAVRGRQNPAFAFSSKLLQEARLMTADMWRSFFLENTSIWGNTKLASNPYKKNPGKIHVNTGKM